LGLCYQGDNTAIGEVFNGFSRKYTLTDQKPCFANATATRKQTMKGPGKPLPLEGVRVVELTHMVMGPACGMVLADLGAEVIKVEPLVGDNTRRLMGAGAGFFPLFNRNKKSLALDITQPAGLEVLLKLLATADVFSENFKPGSMDKLGLGPTALRALNPGLIYVAHKGFLPGPYAQRTALDEVVQMMGGLAYMTGPPGQPLRAGSSVNDIMGGMFGAIGVLAALLQRQTTGQGQVVQTGLFENNILLVAQHMMQFAVTGQPPAPMPSRISAWGIYDVFTVKEGEQIFLAVVSDSQWTAFCDAFGWSDLRVNTHIAMNNQRVQARDWLMPELRRRLQTRSAADIAATFEACGLPCALIKRPQDLFDDPHLQQTQGLSPVRIPFDASMAARDIDTHMALLPLTLNGQRPPLRLPPPSVGQDTAELLSSLGYGAEQQSTLVRQGIVAGTR
jgi:crotonobetainyl-CoA:carnitine CoA-transferase CaiB-like acyl-CoA transferase